MLAPSTGRAAVGPVDFRCWLNTKDPPSFTSSAGTTAALLFTTHLTHAHLTHAHLTHTRCRSVSGVNYLTFTVSRFVCVSMAKQKFKLDKVSPVSSLPVSSLLSSCLLFPPSSALSLSPPFNPCLSLLALSLLHRPPRCSLLLLSLCHWCLAQCEYQWRMSGRESSRGRERAC